MPVVTTAEYVVTAQVICQGPGQALAISGHLAQAARSGSGRTRQRLAGDAAAATFIRVKEITVLVKVFPIKLKDGMQDEVEAIIEEFAPKGPGAEDGTLSFRVYRDPAKPDYLLFVEHFADQAAYQAHTSSAAYRDLIAGQFADRIVEFVEINHELVVSV
jgi:quinol monooxygenase YgiN